MSKQTNKSIENVKVNPMSSQSIAVPVSIDKSSSVFFSVKKTVNENVKIGVKTSDLLYTMYKAYVSKCKVNNLKRNADKQINIKTLNDFSSRILFDLSARIALTLNLSEKSLIENVSLFGAKIQLKSVGNVTATIDLIEEFISSGVITIDGKKMFVFGASYSNDDKIYFRFSNMNEFSKMIKKEDKKPSDLIGKKFNTNIK